MSESEKKGKPVRFANETELKEVMRKYDDGAEDLDRLASLIAQIAELEPQPTMLLMAAMAIVDSTGVNHPELGARMIDPWHHRALTKTRSFDLTQGEN